MKLVPIGKFIIEAPSDTPYSDFHKNHILYDRAFGDLIQEVSGANPEGAFIDIGANIGDSAAMFSTHCINPIICVEGSEKYTAYLRANISLIHNPVTVVEKFVVPQSHAEASLSFQQDRGTGELHATPVESESLVNIADRITVRELHNLAIEKYGSIALFKSDTDGMDGQIIEEALSISDKIFFFECDLKLNFDPSAVSIWPKVFAEFEARRYSAIIFDNFGLPIIAQDVLDARQLMDLCGYIRAQFMTADVRLYYLDIWTFPPASKAVYDGAMNRLRRQLLKPFA